MATRLYAWTLQVVRHPWRVITAWLLLLVAVTALALGLGGKTTSDYSLPGIESQQAQTLLDQRFPEAGNATIRMVFAAPANQTLAQGSAARAVAASLGEAAKAPEVADAGDPVLSTDGRIAYSDVTFAMPDAKVSEKARDQVLAAASPARAAGVQVEFGGSLMQADTEVGGPAEVVGAVVAFAVLAVALGSLIAAGLSLITAAVGVVIGILGVTAVSAFVDMTSTATALALMVGLAVGIDYALFILARHREQLQDRAVDPGTSIARAVATAGGAVVFAGATVVIALAALAVTGIPFLTVMGLAASGTVLLAVLVAISLVPAALALAGERLRPRTTRTTAKPGAWGTAWARAVLRRPVLVLLVGVVGLMALALPVKDLRLGLPSFAAQPATSTQHRGYDLLSQGFGAGANATLAAVVDTKGVPAAQRPAELNRLQAAFTADPGVATVAEPAANAAGTVAVIGIVPKTGPSDQATTDLVHRLRTLAPGTAHAGGALYIAGATALDIDVAAKLADALPLFIVLIVGLALVLLVIAFRSLLVPVKAALGFLLSIGASLGVTVWVFQQGHLADLLGLPSTGPIVSFLPILLIGVLFGLAMDYEVFLVSRMREAHQHRGDPVAAIVHGIAHGGRVVVAAALIMIAVFGGFVFHPDPMIKPIGFALAVGVLIDAFVVRMTLVPAAMALLGHRAWILPDRLARIVPDVDLEGTRLPHADTEAAGNGPLMSADRSS
ncbi:MMPL family transporter [Spirillospora sp. NPDC050679]